MNNSNIWTPEKIERANKLWTDGESAAAIGNVFNVSRNAVLGLAHREREREATMFPKRTSGQGHRAATHRTEAVVRSKPRQPRKPASQRVVGNIPYKPAEPFEPVIDGKAFDAERVAGQLTNGAGPLKDMQSGQCRWPVKTDDKIHGGHLFCGAAVANKYLAERAEGTYCWHHLKRRSQPQ